MAADPAFWWWLDQAVATPELPALLAPDGLMVSRRDLAGTVQRMVSHLLAHGCTRDDRLALVMAPGPALAVTLLGGMAVAAVAPLVPSSPLGVVVEDLQRLRASRLLVDHQPPPAVLEAAAQLGLPVVALDPFRLPADAGPGIAGPASADLALLLQTSGTTSRPKVVPLSHANLLSSSRAVAEVLTLGPEDRSLAAMPLFHIHGIVASLLLIRQQAPLAGLVA